MTWARAALCWAVALLLGLVVLASGPKDDPSVPSADGVTSGAAPAPTAAAVAEPESQPGYVLDPAKLARVEVRRGDRAVILERAGERWTVAAPTDRTIPYGLVQAFVEQLVDSGQGERIGDDARDPAFGLEAPQVTIDASGGGERLTLAIGSRTPTGTAAYALVEQQGRVVLVGLNLLYYADLLLG